MSKGNEDSRLSRLFDFDGDRRYLETTFMESGDEDVIRKMSETCPDGRSCDMECRCVSLSASFCADDSVLVKLVSSDNIRVERNGARVSVSVIPKELHLEKDLSISENGDIFVMKRRGGKDVLSFFDALMLLYWYGDSGRHLLTAMISVFGTSETTDAFLEESCTYYAFNSLMIPGIYSKIPFASAFEKKSMKECMDSVHRKDTVIDWKKFGLAGGSLYVEYSPKVTRPSQRILEEFLISYLSEIKMKSESSGRDYGALRVITSFTVLVREILLRKLGRDMGADTEISFYIQAAKEKKKKVRLDFASVSELHDEYSIFAEPEKSRCGTAMRILGIPGTIAVKKKTVNPFCLVDSMIMKQLLESAAGSIVSFSDGMPDAGTVMNFLSDNRTFTCSGLFTRDRDMHGKVLVTGVCGTAESQDVLSDFASCFCTADIFSMEMGERRADYSLNSLRNKRLPGKLAKQYG